MLAKCSSIKARKNPPQTPRVIKLNLNPYVPLRKPEHPLSDLDKTPQLLDQTICATNFDRLRDLLPDLTMTTSRNIIKIIDNH